MSILSWEVWTILIPLVGAVLAFLWSNRAVRLGLATVHLVFLAVVLLGYEVLVHGVQQHTVGGWEAPLGIVLYADGLAVLMLIMIAMVTWLISWYATAYFADDPGKTQQFWPLWLFLLAAMNALVLSRDIFNIYVTLELVGLAAVALAALAGSAAAIGAAMRYLLVSLLGSLCYLLGVALLYHGYGSVDIVILAQKVLPGPVVWVAMGLMTVGLMMKVALFPLHFWLPPAHASAPAPISAMLSALVVKLGVYLLLRLWLEVFPDDTAALGSVLALLGCLAIVWGSLQALRQSRLKLLVAYSTVAQLGYLFIAFAFAATTSAATAWQGAVFFMLSHALAKAAMFLAAGNLMKFGGHDRIADLDRAVQRLPLTTAAFGLAGVTILGLPPSGGFIAKWMLLEASIETGQWWWAAIMLLGGLLAAAYIFKVLGYAFTQADVTHAPRPVPRRMEWAAFGLAAGSVVLGLIAPFVFDFLAIGQPLEDGS